LGSAGILRVAQDDSQGQGAFAFLRLTAWRLSTGISIFVELTSRLSVILVGLQVVRNAVSSMPLTDTLSEPQLLRLAVSGDEEAFAALYERYKSNVYRFALHMSGSVTLAEDITQDAFITLVEEGAKFDESKGQVLSFLLGIARNFVRRAYRTQGRDAPLTTENDEGEEVELALESGDDTVAEVLRGETADLVREAVHSLPVHYREVVVLCDLCEMTYAEASAQLDCNLGTIRSRLNRAHALLAKKLETRIQSSGKKAGGNIQGCLL
jgi:RNA polymerase sigma-70 factor (ECF subfamily)